MIEVKQMKTVVMLDVLRELQRVECVELGIAQPPGYVSYKLPDGRDNIKQRLWDELANSRYGNQQFTNDSYFIFSVDDELDHSEDVLKMKELCREAINRDINGYETLLFEVCW